MRTALVYLPIEKLMNTKKWYSSKTLWINAIAFIALLVQSQFSFVISPDEQIGILAVINIILRATTKVPLGK